MEQQSSQNEYSQRPATTSKTEGHMIEHYT